MKAKQSQDTVLHFVFSVDITKAMDTEYSTYTIVSKSAFNCQGKF